MVSETNYQYQMRDSAACAVALLALREAGPKLARALLAGPSGGLMQALCMLYRRAIDPKEASHMVGTALAPRQPARPHAALLAACAEGRMALHRSCCVAQGPSPHVALIMISSV